MSSIQFVSRLRVCKGLALLICTLSLSGCSRGQVDDMSGGSDISIGKAADVLERIAVLPNPDAVSSAALTLSPSEAYQRLSSYRLENGITTAVWEDPVLIVDTFYFYMIKQKLDVVVLSGFLVDGNSGAVERVINPNGDVFYLKR